MKQIRNVTKKLKDLLYICCCCYSRLSTSLRRRRDSPSDMGTGYHKRQLYLSIQQRAPRWEGYGAPWVSCGWRGAEVGDQVKKWGVGVRKGILGTGVAASESSLHPSEKVVSEWLRLNNAPFSQQAVTWTFLLLFFSLEIRKLRQWNI